MTNEDERVRNAARRWHEAFKETLRIRIETERPANHQQAAWDLFMLMSEEIADLAIKHRFAELFANDGEFIS